MVSTYRKEREISSLAHPLVKHLVKLRLKRAYRYEKKALFIEGKKLLEELRQPIQTLIICQEASPTLRGDLRAEERYLVSKKVFEKISGVPSPEGVAAQIAMPPFVTLSSQTQILVLDGISDPGNLGTLLRTALAFGFEGVFLTPSTVDPYNEKAIRAAKGATFKLPLEVGHLSDLPDHFHLYIATLEGEAVFSIPFHTPAALLLGNESQGVSKEAKQRGISLTIPQSHQVESLNVAIAGGICMYEMRRSRG